MAGWFQHPASHNIEWHAVISLLEAVGSVAHLTSDSPQRLIHAESCTGYLTPDRYPPALSHRQQVVRAYDRDGRITGGVLAGDGERAMTLIRGLLARPDVTLVHLRNVSYGCYNFAVRRPLSDDSAAALPLAALTAWQALTDTADAQPGQRVLIHGAGGGVGHLAVQIARNLGGYVIAVDGPAKRDGDDRGVRLRLQLLDERRGEPDRAARWSSPRTRRPAGCFIRQAIRLLGGNSQAKTRFITDSRTGSLRCHAVWAVPGTRPRAPGRIPRPGGGRLASRPGAGQQAEAPYP